MEKSLEPPARVFSPWKPRDQWIARCTDIRPLAEENKYAGAKNGSDVLQMMLEAADQSGAPFRGDFLLLRP